MKERILLIGGTGFVGKNLISELNKSYEIKCLIRRSTDTNNIDFLKSLNVIIEYCDGVNKNSIEKSINNINIVIYLIGIIKETKYSKFRELHYENIKNIINICKERKIRKLVYFSALGANTRVTEYFDTKFMAEEEIKNSYLDYIIFRPSIMFGKEDKFVNIFISLIRKYFIVPYFSTKRMQPVYVNDVVKCVRISLKKKWNKIYEIGGKDRLNLEEIFDSIIESLNLARLKIKIPLFFIKIISLIPNSFITKNQFNMLQINNITNFNAEKEFGFKFLGMKEYLKNIK